MHRYLVTRTKASTPQNCQQILGRLASIDTARAIKISKHGLAVWDWWQYAFIDEMDTPPQIRDEKPNQFEPPF